ncbi:MAG: DUF4956 domain-containing protein [Lachnospiraceae bacterium]|nr:DUF4956 domain-containing protein [Lachnospiraceae bacterium]
MFSNILTAETTETMATAGVMICIGASLALGIIVSLVYKYAENGAKKDFLITLAVLPVLVQTVIMMTSGNLGSAVAVMGAFSLVRFRSAPGSAREILFIFYAMAVGLCCGIGQIALAAVITVVVAVFLALLLKSPLGKPDGRIRNLKIRMPEDEDYTSIFTDVFERYTEHVRRKSVRTVNLGSMLDVEYDIRLKDVALEKQFLDELRVRNGNLKVILSQTGETEALS